MQKASDEFFDYTLEKLSEGIYNGDTITKTPFDPELYVDAVTKDNKFIQTKKIRTNRVLVRGPHIISENGNLVEISGYMWDRIPYKDEERYGQETLQRTLFK